MGGGVPGKSGLEELDSARSAVVQPRKLFLVCLILFEHSGTFNIHIVVEGQDGDELTIWDSMESEFASGLEYRGMYK